MRHLASIQRIVAIDDIPGKDRIGLATVLGWHVIVQKSDYLPGDLCVYVEIDSVLPEKPEFEFLRDKNFRIKTMKMAGVVSQGICFPLSVLPKGEYKQGDDVTELLGVKKYDEYADEQPQPSKENVSPMRKFMFRHKLTRPVAMRIWGGTKREHSGFPDEVPKTDETRIQTIPEILERKDVRYIVTEKIDGQSGTFLLRRRRGIRSLWDPFEYIVCSRNRSIPVKDDSSYWQVSEKYGIEDVLRHMIGDCEWVCIQGECIGPKIQGNPYGVTDCDLYCFNLKYPHRSIASDVAAITLKEYGMKWVPILETEYVMPESVDDVLEYATGKSVLADTLREGVVCRCCEKNISWKAVSPQYLMKHDK